MAVNLLGEESAFWLKDYCQKVLLSEFCKGEKEYFGKKRMTLHVDVIFFLDSNGDLQKNVYFTTVSFHFHLFHSISKKSTSIDLKKNVKNAIIISNNYIIT